MDAAFWGPAAIAGRARRYNFRTDAAARFERGVDGSTTAEHLEYVTRLILEVCGGQAGPVDDQISALPAREPVALRLARARKVSGIDLSDDEIIAALERLRLPVRRDGDSVVVTPPPFRFDLQIEEDLIEEVLRVWGYERLPLRPPKASAPMRPAPEGRRSPVALKRAVADRDYQEAIQYSFVESALDKRLSGVDAIRLLNPIAAQMDVMRTTLWGGLMETLRANLNRKASRVRLFELGRVFLADAQVAAGPQQVQGVAQPLRLALLAFGPSLDEQWGAPARRVDFFDVKGDLEVLAGAGLSVRADTHPALHPGRCARLLIDGEPVGWLGELHPAVQQAFELPQAPVLAELDVEPLLRRPVPVYSEPSKFPPVIRDLALLVDAGLAAGTVQAEIARAVAEKPAARVVKNVKLFDEYRGKGLENKEKSLAFRLWMQDTERTLSEAEAAQAVEAIVAHLAQTIQARLRSGA
ncbi:MAG: phenylalanine--tRNA ligase subunit beta [Burkholderiaceae bacterium]